MHKILIIALSILCIVEKVFSQSPIPAKGIENILNQSREYVSQPYFTDTILVKRIDSLMHSTYSGEETFKTVFQVGLSLCNINRKEEAVKYLSYCLSVIKDVFPESLGAPKTV